VFFCVSSLAYFADDVVVLRAPPFFTYLPSQLIVSAATCMFDSRAE